MSSSAHYYMHLEVGFSPLQPALRRAFVSQRVSPRRSFSSPRARGLWINGPIHRSLEIAADWFTSSVFLRDCTVVIIRARGSSSRSSRQQQHQHLEYLFFFSSAPLFLFSELSRDVITPIVITREEKSIGTPLPGHRWGMLLFNKSGLFDDCSDLYRTFIIKKADKCRDMFMVRRVIFIGYCTKTSTYSLVYSDLSFLNKLRYLWNRRELLRCTVHFF